MNRYLFKNREQKWNVVRKINTQVKYKYLKQNIFWLHTSPN